MLKKQLKLACIVAWDITLTPGAARSGPTRARPWLVARQSFGQVLRPFVVARRLPVYGLPSLKRN